VKAAERLGLVRHHGPDALTDEFVGQLLVALRTPPDRPHGETWDRCAGKHELIAKHLKNGVQLTKIRKLLGRQRVHVPYATLHRYAVSELGFGRRALTIPVADCGPGEELQLDTGWVGWLEPDLFGKRRRFRAWIFTSVCSRHRFVWPCFQETTESAIEACEEAWAFYGGIFRVLIPDNTKTIVHTADPLGARIVQAFLDYARLVACRRSTRVRSRKTRPASVLCLTYATMSPASASRPDVARPSLVGGVSDDYGARRHSRQRMPREHSRPRRSLTASGLASRTTSCWAGPRSAAINWPRCQSPTPAHPVRPLTARANRASSASTTAACSSRLTPAPVYLHQRLPAREDSHAPRVDFLKRTAASHGEAIGRFAAALLDDPLPWTRMRRVYALLGLVRRYGQARVNEACATALDHQLLDVRRLGRMLALACQSSVPAHQAAPKIIPLARYLRPASQYSIPRLLEPHNDGDNR
jgi:hypothetical protein